MKTLLLLLLISTNTSAACYAQIGVGKNLNLTGASIPWQRGGSKIGGLLAAYCDYKLKDDVFLRYGWAHISNLDAGPPFNQNDESSVDHIGVSLIWKFYD